MYSPTNLYDPITICKTNYIKQRYPFHGRIFNHSDITVSIIIKPLNTKFHLNFDVKDYKRSLRDEVFKIRFSIALLNYIWMSHFVTFYA